MRIHDATAGHTFFAVPRRRGVPYNGRMAQTIAKQLSGNLRAIREALGMTQDEFAEAAGVSQAHISRLENAKGWVSIQATADAIARAGGEPCDLLRAPEAPVLTPELREIADLVQQVDDGTRAIVLAILRRETSRRAITAVG